MRVLLVWEKVPEETEFYLFEEPDEATVGVLQGAHNTFIGSRTENEDTAALGDILDEREPVDDEDEGISGPFDIVFHSGVLL